MTQIPAPPDAAADHAPVRWRRILCLLLALITLALYLPVRHFEFNNYDDAQYLTKNPWVQYGLRRETINWAFTTGYAGNWHPLTWLSHMLDWQLYGANAGGHHLTSALLHVANTLLLCGLLCRLTGSLWRPAFVAAVFAWHPLRAESVAWVAERKDVLCAFFGLLSLWAWSSYVEKSKVQGPSASAKATADKKSMIAYVMALLFFALGLMSKPMLVSLPLILLLLDFWPLDRMAVPWAARPATNGTVRRLPVTTLLLEKTPFFLLTLVLCFVTFKVQKAGGAMLMDNRTELYRVANALNSCVGYLGKIFWPVNLAVPYPYPDHLPAGRVIAVALFLATLTCAVMLLARSRPHLAVGWFWFIIMLIPVIGIVQVGEQAMADRYTYLPSIGIAIMVAWEVPGWLAGRRDAKIVLAVAAGLALAGCLAVTSRQIQYWHDSAALFTHAIEITGENAVAQCNLGEALIQQGKPDEALLHLNEALRLRPGYPQALNNKAMVLSQHGQVNDAIALLQQTLAEKPDWSDARRNLGQILLDQGRYVESAAEFQTAIRDNSSDVQALTDLGIALAHQGRLDDAMAEYRKALAIVPNAFAENALGGALDSQGHTEEAAQHYLAAIKIKPDFAEARNNLGAVLNSRGKFAEARDQFAAALKIKPDFADAHYNLGNALVALGDLKQAAVEYNADLRLETNDAEAHLNLARILDHEKDLPGAAGHYAEALRVRPDFAEAHAGLAVVLLEEGEDKVAMEHLRTTLKLKPGDAATMRKLAWVLATDANPDLRDGAEALRLATLANQQAAPATASDWDTQAAAAAAAGQFSNAVSAAKKALELANAAGQKDLAALIQSRLTLYQAGTAFHEGR